MDLILPDVEIRPVQMLESMGRTRKRASRGATTGAREGATGTWKWGDEK